jgi:hypothetical protein
MLDANRSRGSHGSFRTAIAALTVVGAVVLGTAASAPFPTRIDFPDGWRAEGIYAGAGNTFYAGDTTNGAIYKGDVRTGEGSVLVQGVAGRSALGLAVDRWNRLWVAGGGGTARHAYVYDADTGVLIQDIVLTTAAGFGIINDVAITGDAAYFTNTNNAANPQASVLFKVPLGKHGVIGTPETVPVPFIGGTESRRHRTARRSSSCRSRWASTTRSTPRPVRPGRSRSKESLRAGTA